MEKENLVLSRMAQRFPALDIQKAAITVRRIYWEIPSDIFMDVLRHAISDLGFTHLCTITGLDSGDCFEFIYHISNEDGILLNLKRKAAKDNPVIETVLPLYPGATFYERELEGILGVKVEGLPEGRQYPLPDNWPKGQYPLRKDWKPEMLKAKTEEDV